MKGGRGGGGHILVVEGSEFFFDMDSTCCSAGRQCCPYIPDNVQSGCHTRQPVHCTGTGDSWGSCRSLADTGHIADRTRWAYRDTGPSARHRSCLESQCRYNYKLENYMLFIKRV